MTENDELNKRDLLGLPQTRLLFWLPWVLILIGFFIEGVTRTVLWTTGFSLIGIACLENVRRCRRRFCLGSGPVYVLAALVSLLYGVRVLPLGMHGWYWILGATVAASLSFGLFLEKIYGKYPNAQ